MIDQSDLKTVRQLAATVSIVAVAVTSITLCYLPRAYSCGLEPGINGGITISYPGSIEVALAVASARSNGLLPAANSELIPNEVLLQEMLTDLRRLHTRFNSARNEMPDGRASTFSLVLVGPGLWSHFRMTSGGVLANYHTDGPLDGKVVVLTHATVLHAILAGKLAIDRATELGLIAYSGVDTSLIQQAFEISLQAKT